MPSYLKHHFDLGVASETDTLRRVIVHTPGDEMERVDPAQRLDLLFDDILYLEHAQREHLVMCAVFEKIVGQSDAVLEISDLLHETLLEEDARFDLVDQLVRIVQIANLQAFEQDLKNLDPDDLHRFVLTGESPLALHALPLPNLLFTRDLAAVVNGHIVISYPATAARARESLVIGLILRHHPAFAAHRENLIELPPGVTFEGGDLLVASEEVVLIGLSERTSFGGVMAVAQQLFDRTPVEHVVMVDVPKRRSYMHLDTVFTFAGRDTCVVFPPLFLYDDPGNVVHFQPGDAPGRFVSEVRPRLKGILEALLGHSLTFVPCGGEDRLSQEREQWTDGANFFAIAPDVVIGYERNAGTFAEMQQHGYRIVEATDFLLEHANQPYASGEKVAIKLGGTELSRGRGGPRCMTMPITRTAENG